MPGEPLKTLGKYELLDLLGAGAYAEVFRARDARLKRIVALKVLKPALIADEDAFQRFLLEAQAACDLFHPHIATVLDLGEADGRVFLAMRFIDGPSLAQRLKEKGPLSWNEALEITRQVGGALDFAHARGLVHRDVKPGNILLGAEGAVLTDFGLVRAVAAGSSLTRTGSFIGTPQYMPPEVWQGQPAEAAADQYALACVLAEMLTGKALFDAPTPPAVMLSHFQPRLLPGQWPGGAPDGLGEVLHKALAQPPNERYAGISQFLAALTQPPAQKPKEAAPAEKISPLPGAPAAAAAGSRMSLLLAEGIPMEFVRIIAGEFLMGSDKKQDPQASASELPQHKVTLSEYWIARYPVTVAQFAAFVKSSGYQCQAVVDPKKADHPVTGVSWADANAFCTWLTRTAQAGGKSGMVISLPTEAEWEKAARGADGRIYPWGSQDPNPRLCNYDQKVGGTTPVGQYSPQGDSPYGCADMAGNVLEWTADWYDEAYYQHSAGKDPGGASTGEYRVSRGGSWNYDARNIRSALRLRGTPGNGNNYIGFRCAASS